MARIEKPTLRRRQRANKVYPKTIASQVICADGVSVEQKIADTLGDIETLLSRI